MTKEGPRSSESPSKVRAELFTPNTKTWDSVRSQILEIDQACFGEKSFDEEYLQESFEDPNNIIVLLNKSDTLIGFSLGVPDKKVEQALHIDATDILPSEQGNGHVVPLIQALEAEARKRGFRFLTRSAAIENGYADKIQKNYIGRIVESHERDSEWGPQRYFKIEL